jgi:UDP:flavonoid glycosyltransferase YjiC (YdhE family)
MKFLLVPGNNSLSHVAKCAALQAALSARGHSALIAVARHYRRFLQDLNLPYTILPDIQESDGGALPSVNWFRSPALLKDCLQAEIDLLESYRPDRVVGIFRFTTRVSTAVLDIPYGAVACGCMMPDVGEVLGFGPDEERAADQAFFLDNFFRFAAKKMSLAMNHFGIGPVDDIRHLLAGDRTFLWDYPQFMPLPRVEDRSHVGPLSWGRWPGGCSPPPPFFKTDLPLALVSLGTRQASRSVVVKAVRCLLSSGYNVIVACGGNGNLMDIFPGNPQVRCWRFAPLEKLLCHADLMVCHGGQMTIFEALWHRVPVLVIPSQPEQAHNGLCVERIGCGRRLTPSVAFRGDQQVYADAFTDQPDAELMETIAHVQASSDIARMLTIARKQLLNYDAPNMIAARMETL